MYRCYFLIIVLIIGVNSCALFESNDEVPMFIEVNSVQLETKTGEGTNRHAIRDIWPSVDGQTIGVFEMPISFPVLSEDDEVRMIYQAGIKRVGFAEDHTIYPFFDTIDVSRAYGSNNIIVEDLIFKYKDDVRFRFIEAFDAQHVFVRAIDDDDDTNMIIKNDDCAEGSCGVIELTPENPEFAAATSDAYDVPTNGGPVYLELEYKTEVNLSIGLQAIVNGTDFEQYFLTLPPNDTWRKVYIDLAPTLQLSQLEAYRIVLGALSLEDSSVEVRVDNIKLLHR